MLQVEIPSERSLPLRWVCEFVFGEVLGVAVELIDSEKPQVTVSHEGRRLVIDSRFPDLSAGAARELPLPGPALPLAEWRPDRLGIDSPQIEASLPILFGEARVDVSGHVIDCGIDLFGSIFFMLSRCEEVHHAERDAHGRFPGSESLAWKAGFLFRPLVDEYVALLWELLSRLWPGLSRRLRTGEVVPSCDVDRPFSRPVEGIAALTRLLAGDLTKRGGPSTAWSRARHYASGGRDPRFDPLYTFDWYMDVCERYGRRASFYFLADRRNERFDASYEIDEPRVLELLAAIDGRGHEIGMHGSYESSIDPGQLRIEREKLALACERAGVPSAVSGNRQHYLRWSVESTPDRLEEAGFSYDSSGGFADLPGFRFGTSHPFRMWSWQKGEPLALVQRPLVLMEASVISDSYMGLGYGEAAMSLMLELKRKALVHGGPFTFLWHNSHLLEHGDRDLFDALAA